MPVPVDRERDLAKCEDMRIHVARARDFLGAMSLAEFEKDELRQAAVVRCIEVIGEAARSISEATRRDAPEIPWQLIIGMRNVLAHDYGTVDLPRVYEVVTDHLPALLGHTTALIARLERETNWQAEGE
ncbi:MAG TPA: DUF86 domain-containing protein [Candidatus Latescibacteria bacterium]|nr:DUF86 domain-containing protein [Candidatus Latescibacterota bacterium]